MPIIRSWALTRGYALHPGTRNRYEIRYTRTQHRPPSRQVNDHGRVSGTHRQDPTRDHPLPQAPHRTRDLPAAHPPAPSPTRREPAPPAHPTRPHPRRRSPSPPHPHHPHLSTRTGPLPQPRPRRTLPTTPRPNHDLTNIGASQFSAPTGSLIISITDSSRASTPAQGPSTTPLPMFTRRLTR